MSILRDALDELGNVSGKGRIVDGVLPPLLFVSVNAIWDVKTAAYAGFGLALIIVIWRLGRRGSPGYALAGLLGTGLAVGLALSSGEARTYFLPGIVTGAVTSGVILISIAVRRPFVAWSSWATRQWPLEWYWHDRVRPAYTSTSWMWFGFFSVRTSAQGWLYASDQTAVLGVVRAVTGWPGLLALLVATYAFGTRILAKLEGPSIDEFLAGSPPPWKSQTSGF